MKNTSGFWTEEEHATDKGPVFMYYVIMDLEWNNVYNRKIQGCVNEILEIGAVMVDENMDVIDTFSAIIKSQLSKKISGSRAIMRKRVKIRSCRLGR